MRLYLIQHGTATPADKDQARPLTDDGRMQVERVSRFFRRCRFAPRRIVHSGKQRARETAQILAGHLESGEPEEQDGLAPNDNPSIVAARIEHFDGDTMMVGHLPHLSRLASLLLTGRTEPELVRFRNGGVVALERSREGWLVTWMVTPDLHV